MTETTAAHWILSLFQTILSKPQRWLCMKMPVDQQFSEKQSHLNPLSFPFSCSCNPGFGWEACHGCGCCGLQRFKLLIKMIHTVMAGQRMLYSSDLKRKKKHRCSSDRVWQLNVTFLSVHCSTQEGQTKDNIKEKLNILKLCTQAVI